MVGLANDFTHLLGRKEQKLFIKSLVRSIATFDMQFDLLVLLYLLHMLKCRTGNISRKTQEKHV